ncbi:MAG: DUF1926 domain-containing protein [Nitrosomonas sp.]|nr:DUF1926 domain-containing protein [Nitrosomonas sp.]
MSQSVSLLFGVHAHQPVGNFPEVLEDAHIRCYKPFLHVVHRYPDFKFAVHFSGWLLDYLFEHHPEDMKLLRAMVKRGQVELFSAGDTEPVLATIPNRDRIGQLETFSKKLSRKLGQRPQGAWLTERVWESTVIPALADCGINYVIVDDYHFLCAGKTKAELKKFGIWPETYQWVYEKGWLEQFIQGALSSSRITTSHYCDYHASEKSRGIIYLPTTSYIEMNEWTLPAEQANRYADLIQQAKASGAYEHNKPFLRGGIWKNFFSRYPESNWMHKRMLSLSQRFALLPGKQQSARIREKLYASQANDAYWHGLFGGLYLPHLRRAVFNNIVELEAMLDLIVPRPAIYKEDTDLDGVEEIYLNNRMLQVISKLDGTASICEFDAYKLKHNFGDTLRRQEEHYYRKIKCDIPNLQRQSESGIASAHDRLSFKHQINSADLEGGMNAQTLFIESINDHSMIYQLESKQDSCIKFQTEFNGYKINKKIELIENQLLITYTSKSRIEANLKTELNLAMPSCDGVGGKYVIDELVLGGFGQRIDLMGFTNILLEDSTLRGKLLLTVTCESKFEAMPFYSVSQSEGGFEKIMQAVKLVLVWPYVPEQLTITLTAIELNEAA